MTRRRRGDGHPKLVDLAPTWRPYRGWTVLHCPVSAAVGRPYDTADETPENRRWYDAVAAVVSPDRLDGLAPLPPSTYHVTICDGLSPMHLPRLGRLRRAVVRRRLASLPGTLDELDRYTFGLGEEVGTLLSACRREITYEATGVEARGTAVVVALRPAETDVFDEIAARRAQLLTGLGERVGTSLTTEWRPHVTLAYGADRSTVAALATQELLTRDVLAATDSARLRFVHAEVFAFDDMVTYWRRPAPTG